MHSNTSKQKVNPLSFAVNSSPKFFHNRLNFNQSQIYRMIPSMSIFDIYDYLSPFIQKYAIIFVWLLIGFRFIDLSMSTYLIILFMLWCIPGNISISIFCERRFTYCISYFNLLLRLIHNIFTFDLLDFLTFFYFLWNMICRWFC